MIENKKYWQEVAAARIIGRNAFPGEEFFSLLNHHAEILDLGCGTGEMAELLSSHGYRVKGIDINAEAVARNRERGSGVEYVLGDITEGLPFEDASFDAVVISFVLVNIIPRSGRERLLLELSRILRPGGVVWVNEGLVSDDYAKRYELCRPFLGDDHDFFVFQEGVSSSSIQDSGALQKAIDDGKVARVAHHFTVGELKQLFHAYELVFEEESATSSPHSKSVINMAVMVFLREN